MKNACKIGKVTYKDSNLVSFPDMSVTGKRESLMNCARSIVGEFEDLEGFVIIGWQGDKDLTYYQSGDMHTVLLPAYAAEILRQKIYDNAT